MQAHRRRPSAADDLHLSPTGCSLKRLCHCFFGGEARGEVLGGTAMAIAVRPLMIRKAASLEPRVALQRGLDAADLNDIYADSCDPVRNSGPPPSGNRAGDEMALVLPARSTAATAY